MKVLEIERGGNQNVFCLVGVRLSIFCNNPPENRETFLTGFVLRFSPTVDFLTHRRSYVGSHKHLGSLKWRSLRNGVLFHVIFRGHEECVSAFVKLLSFGRNRRQIEMIAPSIFHEYFTIGKWDVVFFSVLIR